MADRAVTLSGVFMKVTLGPTSKVLGAGKYTLSGVARRTVDVSEFGIDIDLHEWSAAAGGTIALTDVNYDPTDPAQLMLETAVLDKRKFGRDITTSGLRFWINSTSYFSIGTSGNILLTTCRRIDADRNGVAKTNFDGIISGAAMFLT